VRERIDVMSESGEVQGQSGTDDLEADLSLDDDRSDEVVGGTTNSAKLNKKAESEVAGVNVVKTF
jgi:hypothetical protein